MPSASIAGRAAALRLVAPSISAKAGGTNARPFELAQQKLASQKRPVRPTFVRPLIPSSAKIPPRGADWIHEPKWDGYRFQVLKNGRAVKLYARGRVDHSDRLLRMAEWFTNLPAHSAVLDGELCLLPASGLPDFRMLFAEMRKRQPDETQLMFLAFDLLHQDGLDLRRLPLTERKRDLHRLCASSRIPFLRLVQAFPDGAVLLEHCEKFGFEGIVSKRLGSRYMSGLSRAWVKVKCAGWKAANENRAELFE